MLLLIRMRSVCIQLNTNVIKGLVKRAQLLWHVHNFCETAQLLGNVHSISETCTYRILENTGWGWWNTLYPYMYMCVCVYIWLLYMSVWINLFVCIVTWQYFDWGNWWYTLINLISDRSRLVSLECWKPTAWRVHIETMSASHRSYLLKNHGCPHNQQPWILRSVATSHATLIR